MEVCVAMALFSVAAIATMSLTISSASLQVTNEEKAQAAQGARKVVEAMQSVPFEEVFARFNSDPTDDPDGPGTAVGSTFDVQKLDSGTRTGTLLTTTTATRTAGALVKLNARVTFPTSTDGHLSEVASVTPGGSAWDLNGDGQITSGNRITDYKVLPVEIRITWTSKFGSHAMKFPRVLTRSK